MELPVYLQLLVLLATLIGTALRLIHTYAVFHSRTIARTSKRTRLATTSLFVAVLSPVFLLISSLSVFYIVVACSGLCGTMADDDAQEVRPHLAGMFATVPWVIGSSLLALWQYLRERSVQSVFYRTPAILFASFSIFLSLQLLSALVLVLFAPCWAGYDNKSPACLLQGSGGTFLVVSNASFQAIKVVVTVLGLAVFVRPLLLREDWEKVDRLASPGPSGRPPSILPSIIRRTAIGSGVFAGSVLIFLIW